MTVGFSASSASFGGHSDLSHVHKEKKRGVCLSAGRVGGLLSEGAAPAKEAAPHCFSFVGAPACSCTRHSLQNRKVPVVFAEMIESRRLADSCRPRLESHKRALG